MEYKSVRMFTKVDEEDPRKITGVAAVIGNIDSGGDRIIRGAFKKSIQENLDRVRHLWQHESRKPPIASIVDIQEVGRGGLPDEVKKGRPEVKGGLVVVRKYLETERANEVLAGLTSDPPAISEMSFAFDPVKWDYEEIKADDDELPSRLVRNLVELRLWDTSDVNWGMNPLTVAVKAALPFKDTGIADESAPWSKPSLSKFSDDGWEDLSDAQKRRIAAHFAWSANNPPESYGDLKLPHHKAQPGGVGPAVWKGVRGAMNVLMGGRGGVDIPKGDRKGIYNHLVKHYEQFEKDPPDFKLVDLSHEVVVASGLEQLILGREVLDVEVVELMDAFEIVKRILMAAEPPPVVPEKDLVALTEQTLQRLDIAERTRQSIQGDFS